MVSFLDLFSVLQCLFSIDALMYGKNLEKESYNPKTRSLKNEGLCANSGGNPKELERGNEALKEQSSPLT